MKFAILIQLFVCLALLSLIGATRIERFSDSMGDTGLLRSDSRIQKRATNNKYKSINDYMNKIIEDMRESTSTLKKYNDENDKEKKGTTAAPTSSTTAALTSSTTPATTSSTTAATTSSTTSSTTAATPSSTTSSTTAATPARNTTAL